MDPDFEFGMQRREFLKRLGAGFAALLPASATIRKAEDGSVVYSKYATVGEGSKNSFTLDFGKAVPGTKFCVLDRLTNEVLAMGITDEASVEIPLGSEDRDLIVQTRARGYLAFMTHTAYRNGESALSIERIKDLEENRQGNFWGIEEGTSQDRGSDELRPTFL